MIAARLRKKLSSTSYMEPDDARPNVSLKSAPVYDPFSEFDFSSVQSESPVQAAISAFLKNPGPVDAVFYELGPRGYRLVHCTETSDVIARLSENAGGRPARMLESFQSSEDLTGTPGSEFIQLLMGPFTRQQYLYDYLKMHAQAWYAWNHDPVARRAVKFFGDFVFGDIPKIRAISGESDQKKWDEFARANNLWKRCSTWSDELSIYGELFLVFEGGSIRSIDPSTVLEIVTEPEDIERVYYYHVQYPTQYQLYTSPGIRSSAYVMRQVPSDRVMHIKINSVSNEKRGRSDLLPVLGWLKMLRDYVTNSAIKRRNEAAFVWDVTVTGSAQDVAAYQASVADKPLPTPGSEFVHNEKLKREAIAPAVSRASVSNTADWILSMIANGVGIPIGYFATPAEVATTRASALVQTEPVARTIRARQSIWERVLMEMARRIGIEIEVVFPEIHPENRTDKLNQISLAERHGWLSNRTAAEMASRELGITTYDYDAEKSAIDRDISSALPVWARDDIASNGRGAELAGSELAAMKSAYRRL